MRETYSTLLQLTRDFAGDDSTTSTTSLTNTRAFLANQINSTVQYLFSLIKNYKTQPLPRTFSTVANQIYYHYPPGLLSLHSIVMAIGDEDFTLKPIHSQEVWDSYQESDLTSSDIPQYYFPRQHDFGIWPTPADAYTTTIVGNFLPLRLSVIDYTSGTISITQNSQTVTGVGTTFTAEMVGRWLCQTDSSGIPIGNWYRIGGFTSPTVITLDTYFEESSLSGSTYLIGQSPELPEELHEYIPYRAASIFHSTVRRDPKRAQELLNFFYTGDFFNTRRGGGIKGGVLGVVNEYKNKGRANSQLIGMHKIPYDHWRDERWTTTLSAA